MAETINVLGKPLPKTAVYIFGAGAAGIVGYAWFTSGRGDVVAPVLPEPVPEPTDVPGFDVIGGGGPPGTNADWAQKAIDYWVNYGIDGTAMGSALGKFLARKPLNTVEADLVRMAISVAGQPPEYGPWTIIDEIPGGVVQPPPPPPPPPGTTPTPPAPTPSQPQEVFPPHGAQAFGHRGWAELHWQHGSGNLSGYEYRWETANEQSPWQGVGLTSQYGAPVLVPEDTQFSFAIRGIGPGGVRTAASHTNTVWVYA